jgi:hypothetical protein
MARRLVATAGMGAIIAMGVLSACAKEQKAPEPTTPNNPTGGNLFSPSGQGARTADAGSRQPTRQQVEHVRACSHVTLATTNARLVDQVQIAAAVTALLCRRSRRMPHGRWPC